MLIAMGHYVILSAFYCLSLHVHSTSWGLFLHLVSFVSPKPVTQPTHNKYILGEKKKKEWTSEIGSYFNLPLSAMPASSFSPHSTLQTHPSASWWSLQFHAPVSFTHFFYWFGISLTLPHFPPHTHICMRAHTHAHTHTCTHPHLPLKTPSDQAPSILLKHFCLHAVFHYHPSRFLHSFI